MRLLPSPSSSSRPWPLLSLLGLALLLLVSSVAAWDNEDHELFALQASLEELEGPGADFYSFFQVPRAASAADIRKAYRKRSMELHPDKNMQDPQAQKRFERLGLINKVLRDERRDRYDHFLRNGFPKWKTLASGGGGYFYERFRPGFGAALLLVSAASVGAQLLVQLVERRKHLRRYRHVRDSALAQAWGPRFRAALLAPPSSRPAKERESSKAKPPSAPNAPKVPAERKVRVAVGAGAPLLELPPAPTREAAARGEVDFDEEERKVRHALAAAKAAAGGGGGAGAGGAPRFVDVVVRREVVAVGDATGATTPTATSLSEAAEVVEARLFVVDPETGEQVELLEDDAAPAPSLRRTWPAALLRAAGRRLGVAGTGAGGADAAAGQVEGAADEDDDDDQDGSVKRGGGGSAAAAAGKVPSALDDAELEGYEVVASGASTPAAGSGGGNNGGGGGGGGGGASSRKRKGAAGGKKQR